MRIYIRLILLHCALPLLAGALVYLVFRPANFLTHFFQVDANLAVKYPLLRTFFFVLPDFCWSYSLASALFLFARYYTFPFSAAALLIFSVVAGSELVQLFFPTYFTFDVLDLAASVLAFLLSMLQLKRLAYEEKYN